MATDKEFSYTMGIPFDRFMDIQHKFFKMVEMDFEYPDLINQLLGICTSDREFILAGICLGRAMQSDLCNKCRKEDDELPEDPNLN